MLNGTQFEEPNHMQTKLTLKTIVFAALAMVTFQGCQEVSASERVRSWMSDMLTPRPPAAEVVADGFSVSGQLRNMPNRLVVLQEVKKGGWFFIDSARTDAEGKFSLDGNTKEDVFCALQWDSSSYVLMALNNKSNVQLEITGFNPYISYSLSGTEIQQSTDLKEFVELSAGFDFKLQSIQQQASRLGNGQEDYVKASMLQQQFYEILDMRTKAFREFMLRKPKSLVPYMVFTYYMNQEYEFADLEAAYKAVSAFNPASKYTTELAAIYNAEKLLAVGSPAPEIIQNDPNGKPVALSSLKGKVVLIDFWASWCRPCRMENPNVVKMYRRLKSKGFEIYGVSLDGDANAWKNAIAKDSLTWYHVSDLRQWQNAAAKLYKVSGIPYTVLLDRNGNIAAKGLRGPDLEAKVEELLAAPSGKQK